MKAAWLCCGWIALLPASAAAHALPFGIALSWTSDRAERPWVLTNRGVVFDGSAGPMLRCNEAFGVNTSAYPAIWASEEGLSIVTQHGAFVSTDRGCSLQPAANLPDIAPAGVTVLNDAQQTLLVSSASYLIPGGIYASTDHGRSFQKRADNLPGESFTRLVTVPGMAQRVVASGIQFDATAQKLGYVWAVSDDAGSSFTRTQLEAERTVLGCAPDGQLFAFETLSSAGPDVQILRSSNAGQTFTPVMRLLGRPSFAAVGDALYLGAASTVGLLTSRDGGVTFARSHDELSSITCLQGRGGALYVCATRHPLQQGVWRVEDDFALEDELLFSQVRAQVECDASESVCTQPWVDWTAELLSEPVAAADPGVEQRDAALSEALPDAAVVDASEPAARSRRSADCSSALHTRGSGGGELLLALLGLSVLRRPRSRRAPPRS